MQWTQAHWRQSRSPQRPLGWGQRSALIVLAIAAVPIVLTLFAGLFLLAAGLGAVALVAWVIGSLLRPRRTRPSAATVITTDYRRLSEENETPAPRNPWTRP